MEIDSYSELIARCMQQCMDPTILDAFRQFLLRNGDQEWLIVSDYHMEKSDPYENYVSVFTVLPAGEHFLDRAAMDAGLPKKLSQNTVTESDINFFKNLNHFTFIFVSDKKFRAAAPTVESARAGIDKSIENMMKWKNANQCKDVIAEFRRLREDAKAVGFNLKLFNHAALSASCVAVIALIILKTLRVETINWLSDRDAMIDNLDGIVYALFHLNMDAFAQHHKLKPFNLIWFGESAEAQAEGKKKKPLALAPYIRIPDFFAAPIAASQLEADGVQHLDNIKYQRILAYVVADNPNIAVLRLVNTPGWGLKRIVISLTDSSAPDDSVPIRQSVD